MLQEKHGQWEMWISEVVHRRERQKKLEADVSPEFPSLTTGGILSEGQSWEDSEAKQSCWVRSAFVNQLTYWSAQIGALKSNSLHYVRCLAGTCRHGGQNQALSSLWKSPCHVALFRRDNTRLLKPKGFSLPLCKASCCTTILSSL